MNVIHVNFRRQRGFIELPNPFTLLGVGAVIGAIFGVALWEFGQWFFRHLIVGWA
jgi:hypothetical protein